MRQNLHSIIILLDQSSFRRGLVALPGWVVWVSRETRIGRPAPGNSSILFLVRVSGSCFSLDVFQDAISEAIFEC